MADVSPEMPAGCEVLFGPAAAIMRVPHTDHALDEVANSTPYGLGASLWSRDLERTQELSRQIEAGQVFINGMVASDPRLSFGGHQRLRLRARTADLGIRELVNIQTVWIGARQRVAKGSAGSNQVTSFTRKMSTSFRMVPFVCNRLLTLEPPLSWPGPMRRQFRGKAGLGEGER